MGHDHDHTHDHHHEVDPMDAALQPPAEELLAVLQPQLAAMLEEIVAMRGTIAFQNKIITGLQDQLREAASK